MRYCSIAGTRPRFINFEPMYLKRVTGSQPDRWNSAFPQHRFNFVLSRFFESGGALFHRVLRPICCVVYIITLAFLTREAPVVRPRYSHFSANSRTADPVCLNWRHSLFASAPSCLLHPRLEQLAFTPLFSSIFTSRGVGFAALYHDFDIIECPCQE